MGKHYDSPRISNEILDCSFPMTFDQYSNCGFNCQYCFSQYQRGIGTRKVGYVKKEVKPVDVQHIKDMFLLKKKSVFEDFIKRKVPLQWGGLSDPFCPFEKIYGVGLELMKFFAEIEYPISFSSKSDLVLTDNRYLELFAKMKDKWHYKATIITDDPEKAKLLEIGTPTPDRRFEMLKKLSSVGTLTTLRLRPYIIGLTDKSIESLIRKAKEAGCQSVSTEFYCLEMRGTGVKDTVEKYNRISRVLGFNVVDVYKMASKGTGYLRLNYDIKKPYIRQLVELCEKYDLPLFISDAHHKEKSCGTCCCGVLDSNIYFKNYARMHFNEALQIAKKKGFVQWQDIDNLESEWMKKTSINITCGVNTRNTRWREKHLNMNYYDFMKVNWNDYRRGTSIYKYFGGVLIPFGRDKDHNVIYKYDYKKAGL